MNVILFGAPGAGKGTYAKRLKEIYNIPHISTGDLLRNTVQNNPEIGKKLNAYMSVGKFVPDELVFEALKERLKEHDVKKGFLLDGFPRTITQAKMLEEVSKVDCVLNFDVDISVLMYRASWRRICHKCNAIYHLKTIVPKREGICDFCNGKLYQREDDKEEIVKKRQEDYRNQTAPLIEYYKTNNILYTINGNLDLSDPNQHIILDCQKILDSFKT